MSFLFPILQVLRRTKKYAQQCCTAVPFSQYYKMLKRANPDVSLILLTETILFCTIVISYSFGNL